MRNTHTTKGYSLSLLLLNIVLEILVSPVRRMKELNGIQLGKEDVTLPLCADDMVLYFEKPLELTSESSNISGNEINMLR